MSVRGVAEKYGKRSFVSLDMMCLHRSSLPLQQLSYLHDPATKILVRFVILWDVAVSIGGLVGHELFVTIVPTCNGRGNLPLKADRFQLSLSFFGHGS